MAYHVRLVILLLFSEILRDSSAGKCDRKLEIGGAPAEELDGKFFITLWTMNKTDTIDQYMPNTRYVVTIEGEKPKDPFHFEQKFTRFLLTADNQDASSTAEGTFDIIDEILTKFSDRCANSISEASQVLKDRVEVAWVSPPEGSGCILIRATVAESPETWYMDEGRLVRTICQDPRALQDEPGPVLPECCACDEAKYEVTFEGLWSRNTHPKDFPSKGWLIRFSDVIGASHTVDYRFWRYNETASEGLQQVAEFGSTRKLESELKEQSEHIRTIIKARGISHPNVTGRTFAVFRVDRKHHLMSLVSMIDPSPDWIVGVSGLELCLSNCSWIEHKELNLYPVDAGTDDGITYMSPNSSTDPPEPIRRITSSWPNDTRSPFYDPLGLDMKPMARLHLNRQRLYEKTCDDPSSTPVDTGGDIRPTHKPKKACRTTRWGEWGPCSVSCGHGIRLRQRNYKNRQAAKLNSCNVELTERRDCTEGSPECQGRNDEDSGENKGHCAVTNWTDWSECTTTCGEGFKTRSRHFVHKKHRKQCKAARIGLEFEQTIDCENEPCKNVEAITEEDGENVNDDEDGVDNGDNEVEETEAEEEEEEEEKEEDEEKEGEEEEEDQEAEATEEWLQVKNCPEEYSPWSTWSPCSATCGQGMRMRSRLRLDSGTGEPVQCKQQSVVCNAKISHCNITKEVADEICNDLPPTGDCSPRRGNYVSQRVYYDPAGKQCRYFDYTGCNTNRKNDFDTLETCQHICIDIRGGNNDNFNGIEAENQVIVTTEAYDNGEPVDCKLSEWSNWTPCRTCRGFTRQSRKILIYPKNGGKQCENKLKRKHKCHNVVSDCPKKSHSRRRRYRDHKSAWKFNEVSVDCQLTHWSSWSPCNSTCGGAMQRRTRRVRVHPHGPDGKPCTRLVEFRKCKSMIECYY